MYERSNNRVVSSVTAESIAFLAAGVLFAVFGFVTYLDPFVVWLDFGSGLFLISLGVSGYLAANEATSRDTKYSKCYLVLLTVYGVVLCSVYAISLVMTAVFILTFPECDPGINSQCTSEQATSVSAIVVLNVLNAVNCVFVLLFTYALRDARKLARLNSLPY